MIGSYGYVVNMNGAYGILGKLRFDPSQLFKNGEQGVWYDPTDLATMYQEHTGGSPVTANGQPVGLMLDKSRGEIFSDVELVTNGTFDTDLTGWATMYPLAVSLTNENGRLRVTALTPQRMWAYQAIANLVVGKTYVLTVDIFSDTSNNQYYIGFAADAAASGYIPVASGVTNKSVTFPFTARYSTEYLIPQIFSATIGAYVEFDNISVKEVLGTTATQPVATKRPTYKDTPDRLEIDLVDDSLAFTVPTGGIDGYMVVGTDDGTASYGVSLPAGDYDIGGDYFMGGSVNGFLLREGDVSDSDLKKVEAEFVKNGAKASYGDVTDFTEYWRDKNITEFPLIDTSSGTSFINAWLGNNLTSFPLIDTSSGTNFQGAWYNNNLTSFPLLDTSSGTNFYAAWFNNNLTSFPLLDVSNGTSFYAAWYNNNLTSFPLIDTSNGTNFDYAWAYNNLTSFPLLDVSSGTSFDYAWDYNSNLTTFPANMFDSCLATNFANAFSNTNLSEQSIDNILVSINSNGTSNGTFDQSGGSAPSVAGEGAIMVLRARGWTVTVTGGF